MALTLVTGATGFVGSHVVRLLIQRGDEVRITVRDTTRDDVLAGSDDALVGPSIERVRADIRDRSSMRRAMRGIERVFHVAGSADLSLPRDAAFAINLEGTRIVLEEALRAQVQRVVYTSSVAAVGPAPPGETADEQSVWDAGRFRIAYVDSKHAAEEAAVRLGARGLPLVIVNPAHVLGPGEPGRSSTVLVRRFLRRQIPAYVDGTLNIVGVEDVARGHLLADERGEVGERYILGNRNFTLQRLFADLGRLSGVQPPVVKLPLPVALSLAYGAQRTGAAGMPTPTAVRAASLNWAFANGKAQRELGWRPSPHEDCLEDTIAFYRERERDRLSPVGTLQPRLLRLAGAVGRRLPALKR